MKNYTYDTLVNIQRDNLGNVSMVKTNIIAVNEIISQISANIEKSLEDKKKSIVTIQAGSLTGSKLLSGIGPKIEVQISLVGNVSSNLKSEFISTGINQTLHRIYLDISCKVSILTPFETINETVNNQILLAESVIVGNVPEGYYNLDETKSNDNLRIIEK